MRRFLIAVTQILTACRFGQEPEGGVGTPKLRIPAASSG